jgi:hypothetical protein
MSLLDRVRACQDFNPDDYLAFVVDGLQVGRIRAENIVDLADFGDVFAFEGGNVMLRGHIHGFAARTEAMDTVTRELRDRGLISGWREEAYPVGTGYSDPALFDMERAAVPFFGVRGYGVHVNGWVAGPDGPAMWIGRRALHKPTGPGLLDQMVAGGQPSGMALLENVVKECHEEAGMDEALARKAKPVGAISYLTERAEGLRHDVLFNFDIEVPVDFTPVNTDGEVAEFLLWPIERVMEELATRETFKFNSALVIIDFLVRHGFVDPETPGYTDIVAGLHC